MRAVVLAIALLSRGAAAEHYAFDVYLDDRPIGEHVFTVEHRDGGLLVQSDAHFDVTVLKVPVFRYRHSATELWHGTCLSSIDSETQVNGERYWLRGRPGDEGFVLDVQRERSSRQLQLPGCVSTYAYWSPDILASHRHLLNSQTGEYDPVAFTSHPSWSRLEGPSFAIDLRYQGDAWTGLRTLRDGRMLDYRLRAQTSLDVATR